MKNTEMTDGIRQEVLNIMTDHFIKTACEKKSKFEHQIYHEIGIETLNAERTGQLAHDLLYLKWCFEKEIVGYEYSGTDWEGEQDTTPAERNRITGLLDRLINHLTA